MVELTVNNGGVCVCVCVLCESHLSALVCVFKTLDRQHVGFVVHGFAFLACASKVVLSFMTLFFRLCISGM